MMEEEKKPMSAQRITIWVGVIALLATTFGAVGETIFDISGKWSEYQDRKEVREINKNAAITSDSTIAKIIREIDPLTMREFSNYRDSVDAQMRNGKRIAFTYMNAVDSLVQVVNAKDRALIDQQKRIDLLEVELNVSKAKTRDEGLEMVMNTLEKLLNEKSQNQKLDSMMIEIRKLNQKKIESIKSGDRRQ